MPIQIDRLETTVEVTPATSAPRPAAERSDRADSPASAAVLRDAVVQVLADELGHYLRMRGH